MKKIKTKNNEYNFFLYQITESDENTLRGYLHLDQIRLDRLTVSVCLLVELQVAHNSTWAHELLRVVIWHWTSELRTREAAVRWTYIIAHLCTLLQSFVLCLVVFLRWQSWHSNFVRANDAKSSAIMYYERLATTQLSSIFINAIIVPMRRTIISLAVCLVSRAAPHKISLSRLCAFRGGTRYTQV